MFQWTSDFFASWLLCQQLASRPRLLKRCPRAIRRVLIGLGGLWLVFAAGCVHIATDFGRAVSGAGGSVPDSFIYAFFGLFLLGLVWSAVIIGRENH
jgi:hypothetical protein